MMAEPPDLTFDEVSRRNRQRCERWHPGYPDDDEWTGADWSNAMCGEAGETANIVKKLRRHECNLADGGEHLRGHGNPSREELLGALAEECADVYLYLDLLATKYGIDLPEAIVQKFNKVSIRQGFPDRLP